MRACILNPACGTCLHRLVASSAVMRRVCMAQHDKVSTVLIASKAEPTRYESQIPNGSAVATHHGQGPCMSTFVLEVSMTNIA